jgi:polyvinyl alcohol dehydrogenase (cytochrome)
MIHSTNAVLVVFALLSAVATAAPPDGQTLYKDRCGICHDGKVQSRMPAHDEIAQRTPESIYKAMFEGPMITQSAGLSAEEGRAIARFLTGKDFRTAAPSTTIGRCAGKPAPLRMTEAGWNGWGYDLANTRYQPKPGFTADSVPKLKLKWAFGFADETVRSSPATIAGDRVFVGSANGTVYSLDASSGCIHWTYDAGDTVRTAISVGKAARGNGYVAYFGDTRANVHAVDANTGKPLWKVKVDDHSAARITGAPALSEGRLYVPVSSIEEASAMLPSYECCIFRGSIVALDGATGKQLWKSYSIPDPPQVIKTGEGGKRSFGPAGAAIWSAPTVDLKQKVLYAATGNSYTNVSVNTSNAILAFDLASGSMLWASQVLPKDNFTMGCGRGTNCPEERGPDHDFGTSPILRDLPEGKRVLVCGQKSGVVWGLDPDQRGKILWQTRVGQGGSLGGIEWGPTADEQFAYVAVSDLTSRGPNRPGGLHALKLASGEKIWSTPAPALDCTPGTKGCNGAQSAAIASMPGVVFSGSIDGHFRAFLAKTGEIIWDFNTVRDYQTVNSVPAKGGSIDSAGPTIANGMVYTNSGYGQWLGLPGNVLLAFSPDGK